LQLGYALRLQFVTALRELQDFLTQDVFMIASCRSCAAYSIG
jgi:hypothetical protein